MVVLAGFGAAAVLGTGVGVALVTRGGSSSSHRRAATSTSSSISTLASTTTTPTTLPPTTLAPTTTVATAGSQLAAVAGKTILVDPGHNGKNSQHTADINRPIDIGTQTRACDTTGTQGNDGYTESAYNLDVALRLASLLREAGANVVLTRSNDNDWGPCIDERAAIGNRAGAAVGISIHADGGPANGRGFHVIYPPSIPGYTDDIAVASKRLALDVRSAFEAGTSMPRATYIGSDGLSERRDLGGLNLSNIPKVFIETGNMRNATDIGLLENADYRQREAVAVANGLATFLSGS